MSDKPKFPALWRRWHSWWPAFLPWLGFETWEPEDAMLLDLPVRVCWRVLSFEWFHHGFTIAAWPEETPDAR